MLVSHVLNNMAVLYILHVLSAAHHHNFGWLICQMIIHLQYDVVRLVADRTSVSTSAAVTADTDVTLPIHDVSTEITLETFGTF